MTWMGILAWLVKDFGFHTADSQAFHRSQWDDAGHPSTSYLIYRLVFMIMLVSSLTFSTICESHLVFLYLTNWSFWTETAYGVLYFLYMSWKVSRKKFTRASNKERSVENTDPAQSTISGGDADGGGGRITALEKVIWILMNISHTLPYGAVIGYWTITLKDTHYTLACSEFKGKFISHSGVALLVLIDSFMVAIPVRLTHSLFPVGLLSIFSLYSYIYDKAGGEYDLGKDGKEKDYIYPVLNWRHEPEVTCLHVLGGMVGVGLLHGITCWGFYKIRLGLLKLLKRKKDRKESSPNMEMEQVRV